LKRLDDGRQAPTLDLVVEFGLEALEAVMVFGHGPDLCLEDHLLGGRRTDDLTEPTPMRWPPMGTACITDILRKRKAFNRFLAALRSRIASSRARARSRIASSSTSGT
jgi:hypothetical protein